MNLLRAGRTQARAPFAGKECGPPPKCSRVGSKEMPESAAARSAGAGRKGTKSPAEGASVSAASRARKGHLWGSCLGSGQRTGDCRAAGRLESKFAAGTTPRNIEQPLVGKLALGLSRLGRGTAVPRRESPSLSSRVGWGSPGPRLLSSRARTLLTTSGGCFPFTARTPQWRRAVAASPACLARRRNRQATAERENGRKTKEAQPACYTPRDPLSRAVCQIIRQSPEVAPSAGHYQERRRSSAPRLG